MYLDLSQKKILAMCLAGTVYGFYVTERETREVSFIGRVIPDPVESVKNPWAVDPFVGLSPCRPRGPLTQFWYDHQPVCRSTLIPSDASRPHTISENWISTSPRAVLGDWPEVVRDRVHSSLLTGGKPGLSSRWRMTKLRTYKNTKQRKYSMTTMVRTGFSERLNRPFGMPSKPTHISSFVILTTNRFRAFS